MKIAYINSVGRHIGRQFEFLEKKFMVIFFATVTMIQRDFIVVHEKNPVKINKKRENCLY